MDSERRMDVTDKNRMNSRIRIDGWHLLGLGVAALSPAVLLKKLALHPLVAKAGTDRRRREEAMRVM
jgi:hypothetical protein